MTIFNRLKFAYVDKPGVRQNSKTSNDTVHEISDIGFELNFWCSWN